VANNLTQTPIIITAAMSQSWKAAILAAYGSFQNLIVRKVLWENVGASGDTVSITDGQAVTLLTLTGQGPNIPQQVDFIPPVRWRDFQVTTISSGQLSIHLV
jgi:hypothetical protein